MGHWISVILRRIHVTCPRHLASKTGDAAARLRIWRVLLITGFLAHFSGVCICRAATYEIYPASVDSQEEFERLANSLKPGDELVLHGGVYSQNARRAVTAKGTPAQPIVIRAAQGKTPLLTRPADNIDRHNNIEFVDCSHLIIRALRFQGGSCGVRFIRGHHITFEECEIFETGNNALTMNSGDCDAFVIRKNHIHHTGLSSSGSTEGEGMYIGCHSGSCRTTNTLVEANYIHHLRSTSGGGNDGIEIKVRSYGNIVRDNVIHDTNIGRKYPGIFVYGGGPKVNIVEGNVIWKAGEGIQVVSDAIVRNNIIFDCSVTGITAAPHAAVSRMRNVTIVNNTIVNHPRGARIRWSKASNMVFSNNAVYCPGSIAIDASGIGAAAFSANYITGGLSGAAVDGSRFCDGGAISEAFVEAGKNDYWPRAGSRLIGNGDPDFTAKLDFNCSGRKAPFDVGAYQSQGRAVNPGWKIQTGFKSCLGHKDLRKVADFDDDPVRQVSGTR
ncbi:MAG: right-handed parallel beta-helix repeat-containing protein [Planctomycetes bacterium]|nr:right-handed parallel beta-helix repeat-containing protein [Planctomycetota bacterium]